MSENHLASYLAQFDHITSVTPMKIEFPYGKKMETYPACSYLARFKTVENSPAYDRGEREYWKSFIYLIGELPSSYRKNRKIVFQIPGDPEEWFVSSYWPSLLRHKQEIPQIPNEYHPFGPSFLISPWSFPEPIDQYETHKYHRLPIRLTQTQL